MSRDILEEKELRVEFENGGFLQSLLGNQKEAFAYLWAHLKVTAVTRDGWVLFSGAEKNLALVQKIFEELEGARRNGKEITIRDFRLAVDLAAAPGAVEFSEMASIRLLGSRSRKSVSPKTPNQYSYLKAIRDYPVVFGLGPAGTGKTYLAMAMALSLLKAGEVNRVVLTRPAVEAGESLGFLPGDLREKVAPYLRPLYDALQDMVEPEEGQGYLEAGIIEIAPLAYMRGRTLSRSFVILDEAQNTTCEQMFMLLTRLGEGTHCVVTGDRSQTDLKSGIRSGLAEAERSLKTVDDIAFQYFSGEDVVRHPIVGKIIDAYDRARKDGVSS